jgi:YbbR domain-containing protein
MAYNPFRHFWLKTVAVGIAALLWVAVGGEKIVERSLRAPLELQNKPETLEIVGEVPSTVDVRLRGSSTALGRLMPGDVVAVLDVSTAKSGSNMFHLAPDHVRVPFGVGVTYAGPATVPLVLERQERKTVPVVPSVEGEPAAGYAVERVSVDPEQVDVEGPESAMRALRRATTAPVELNGASSTLREVVTIGILNSTARLRQPSSAVVTVNIVAIRTERTMGTVPVRMQNLRAGQSAQSAPSSVAVTVRGGEDALNALTTDAVEAAVDLTGLGAGRYNLPIRIAPSKVFGIVRIDPSQVQVTIR